MANMLKGFWPSGPADQTTPKATSSGGVAPERNPFDAHAASYTAQLQRQHSAQNGAAAAAGARSGDAGAGELSRLADYVAPGEAPGLADAAGFDFSREAQDQGLRGASSSQRLQMQSGELTPSGLRTPGGVTSQSSIPTTSLSTTVPDFTMQMPPKKDKSTAAPLSANLASAPTPDASTNQPATLTQPSTPAYTSSAVPPSPGPGAGSTPAEKGPTRNTNAPKGRLTLKVISGRNLQASSPASRPYAVVSFDKNEFIGREPIDLEEQEALEKEEQAEKGAAASSTVGDASSGNVLNGAFGDGPSRARASTVTPQLVSRTGSGSGSSAYNPVWKHEVQFDVTHENQAIYISVYDRHAEDEGFLGMRQIKPRLFHKMSSDQWYPLTGREELAGAGGAEKGASSNDVQQPENRGEIRIQISYEKMVQRRLTPADFEYMKLIGRGTFGRVFQVRKKDTKRIYAMKVLSKREIAIKKEVTHTMGERKILEKSLDCPFLVGLKFSFQSDTELYFVTDYKSGGELFWHLQREGRFTEERARFYIAELVLALEHLHKFDIVYRDLKPENILLDATGHVALCDFGLSKPDLGNGQLTNTFCGTTEYLAPEVLLDESGYSKLVDFWSLGVLLFEMCCGWSPFYAEDTQQMYRNICFGKIKFPRGAIGDDGKQFVKGLLNRNPKHRLGAHGDASDLKEHAFFKDIDFDTLYQKKIPPPFKPLVESEESVANFDPEFTMTDLREVAEIEGHTLSASTLDKDANGVAIGKSVGNDDDDILSSSIQHQFRGFSYSGRDDAGSFGGSRSRRGSGGFGLAGASLGMSRMMDSPESSPSPVRAMSVDRETPAPNDIDMGS